MIGTYRFFIDGEQVYKCNNLITNYGRIAILRYLASIATVYAGTIAIGSSNHIASITDKELGFEIAQAPIKVRSVDYNNSEILFKATFDPGEKMIITEIGMYPDDSLRRSNMLYFFDADELWSGVQSRNLADVRLGASGIENTALSGGTSTVSMDSQLNLANTLPTDKFCLAFITYDDNCEKITVNFNDINGDIISADFIPETHLNGDGTAQYQVCEVLKQTFTNQSKEWEQIMSVDIDIVAKTSTNTTIVLDGFRLSDSNIPAGSEIVSITSLGTPVTKNSGCTLDIQYSLSVPV